MYALEHELFLVDLVSLRESKNKRIVLIIPKGHNSIGICNK